MPGLANFVLGIKLGLTYSVFYAIEWSVCADETGLVGSSLLDCMRNIPPALGESEWMSMIEIVERYEAEYAVG